MTEQRQPNLTEREILDLSPAKYRRYIEMHPLSVATTQPIGEPTTAQPSAEPVTTGPVVDRPEGRYVRRSTAKKAGLGCAVLVGGAALIGGGLWAGANLLGEPTGTTTPTGAHEPGPSAPSASSETSGFTPRQTDKEHGFAQAKLDLSEFGGPKDLLVDRLDYQPSADKNNPNKVTLMAGAVGDGDFNLDGVWTTDSNAQTGSRILNQKEGAELDSPYGLTVYENFDPKYTDLVMKSVEKNQLGNGCGLTDGCKESIAQVYGADGKLVPYDGTNQPAASVIPEASASIAPCASPTPEPTPTPSCTCGNPEPHTTCVPGYDHDLPNVFNGSLTALKNAFANNPDAVVGKDNQGNDVFAKEYVEVVNPGEKVAIQGDPDVLVNGKIIKEYDNSGATGGVTYISIPEGENKVTVYLVYGGDFHRLDTCTTEDQAKELVKGYIEGMVATYGAGNVKEYDVR